MRDKLPSMCVRFQNLMSGEQGQDLVEYALLVTQRFFQLGGLRL
jgi:hypothetical protein